MVNSLDKEELILKTAMDVFIEKGRHGAKMQEIADRAGINKALLHYYFRTKEKLYAKIFEYLINKNLSELFELFDADLPFADFLRFFISGYMDVINKNPKIPLFMLKELSEGGGTVKAILTNLRNSGKLDKNKIVKKIEQAVKDGEIAPVDPLQLIGTVIGSCLFFFIAEPIFKTIFIEEDNFDRQAFIEQRKEAVYQTILYGILPRGEQQ
ncbi:MAG TPA: TetR family transcriptional regulator [Caldithrix abyssi]|uniref:TetR family transcriptional regulator n=1 Tax=Caldithrix abyssi TaxID=187145 RepID=A0A7V4WVT9_CALAY|nr:TetR family transcriptional regulator [Caldithrix abyssi]